MLHAQETLDAQDGLSLGILSFAAVGVFGQQHFLLRMHLSMQTDGHERKDWFSCILKSWLALLEFLIFHTLHSFSLQFFVAAFTVMLDYFVRTIFLTM